MSGSHFSDHVASTGYPLTHLALPDAIDFTIWEVSEFAVKRGGNSHRRPSPTPYRGAPANEGARGCVGLQRDAGCLAATWWDNGSSPVQIEIRGGVVAMGERLLRRRQVEEVTGMSRSSIYRLMQTGEFPWPVWIGLAAVRWRESGSGRLAIVAAGSEELGWPAQHGLDATCTTGATAISCRFGLP